MDFDFGPQMPFITWPYLQPNGVIVMRTERTKDPSEWSERCVVPRRWLDCREIEEKE